MKALTSMNTVAKCLGMVTLSLAISGGAVFAHDTGGPSSNAAIDASTEHARHMRGSEAGVPTMVGQDAFGSIQEIVRILEADPKTDWSKVKVAVLREHLVDMNEVALRAAALEQTVENGLQIDVTGNGRTLEAIQRLIPAHARQLNELPNWHAATETLPNGVRFVVTASKSGEITHIRGLGFMGLMVSGAHHQAHHLALARGEHAH